MRILLDTNAVLDFLLRRPEGFAKADQIFVHLQNREFDAYVDPITPLNAFYTCRKEIGKPAATRSVQDILRLVYITPTDKKVLTDAFGMGFSDYEDAVQCASAIAAGLDAIVTRTPMILRTHRYPFIHLRNFSTYQTQKQESTEE